MEIHEIQASETWVLRQKLLRPDFNLEQCSYPGDSDVSSHHFACSSNHELRGIVSIYKRSNKAVHSGLGFQIRAMATCEEVRGKGLGLKLLAAAEKVAFNAGADYVWANARTSAIGFYVKAAYKVIGEQFHVDGVGPHLLVYQTKG